jgi:phosphoribosyl-AMP cyclohydrolase
MTEPNPLQQLRFDDKGLIPAIAQDYKTGEVLMMAWMNQEAVELTLKEGRAIYFSRSRNTLWRKGESSGNVQKLHALRTDCDSDVILLQVEQIGDIACHTGRRSCFYQEYQRGQWQTISDVIKDPKEIYS